MMLSREILKLAGRKEKLSQSVGHARAAFRERAGGKRIRCCALEKLSEPQCLLGRDSHPEKRGERKPRGNDCQKVRSTKEGEFFT